MVVPGHPAHEVGVRLDVEGRHPALRPPELEAPALPLHQRGCAIGRGDGPVDAGAAVHAAVHPAAGVRDDQLRDFPRLRFPGQEPEAARRAELDVAAPVLQVRTDRAGKLPVHVDVDPDAFAIGVPLVDEDTAIDRGCHVAVVGDPLPGQDEPPVAVDGMDHRLAVHLRVHETRLGAQRLAGQLLAHLALGVEPADPRGPAGADSLERGAHVGGEPATGQAALGRTRQLPLLGRRLAGDCVRGQQEDESCQGLAGCVHCSALLTRRCRRFPPLPHSQTSRHMRAMAKRPAAANDAAVLT